MRPRSQYMPFANWNRGTDEVVRVPVEEALRDMEHRRVADETIEDLWVSTVFLGIAHDDYPDPDKANWFETMIFRLKPGDRVAVDFQWRYRTGAEARIGHAAVVAWVRAGMPGGGP